MFFSRAYTSLVNGVHASKKACAYKQAFTLSEVCFIVKHNTKNDVKLTKHCITLSSAKKNSKKEFHIPFYLVNLLY